MEPASVQVSPLLPRLTSIGVHHTHLLPYGWTNLPSLSPRRENILSLDEGAGGTAGLVLRKLRALHALPVELELELVQGLAKCLREAGFGVALHIADGDAVRCQVCAPSSRMSPVTHFHPGTSNVQR
jgi:hypothetical protein